MKDLKVLVADDEQVIRELFKKFLGGRGCEVSTAVDGLEALEEIRRNDYDMLILDMKMPRMGGMEVLNNIKKLKKDPIIIVITGYATIESAKEAIKLGCFDYITKPFDADYVSIVIKRAVEMRRHEEAKKRYQEQARITDKLMTLAQMGAGVAHEVNTVLTSIKLFLEVLRPKLSRAKEGKNIKLILDEVGRAEKLIYDFLRFSKPEKTEFIKTDINNTINRCLELIKYKFSKQKIEVVNEINRDLPKINGDPIKMEEAFLNIFSNSIDAMPGGGKLVLSSKITDDSMVISISDTGEGVNPGDIKKLPDPFYTTKPHGTGLGLSIVYRIINEHAGNIEITSAEGKGTCVRLELPLNTRSETE